MRVGAFSKQGSKAGTNHADRRFPSITARIVAFIGDENAPSRAPAFLSQGKERAMFQRRRGLKQTDTLEQHLSEEAERLREQAKLLPPSLVRDAVLREAQLAEAGSQVSAWLRSPK